MKHTNKEKAVYDKSQGASIAMISAKLKTSEKQIKKWIEEEVIYLKGIGFRDEIINYYLNLPGNKRCAGAPSRDAVNAQIALGKAFEKPRTKKQNDKDWQKKKCAMLFRSGSKPKYISEILDISQATICRWLKKLGKITYSKEEERQAFEELTK